MPKAIPHRSWLFVPGDRPDRFTKALSSGADAVILDLEDSVSATKLESAIASVDLILAQHSIGSGRSIWVRVDNAISRRPEVQGLASHSSLEGFVIPKFETAEQCAGWHKPVVAIIETARGVVDAARITREAAVDLHGIALGPEDLSTALGVAPNLSSLIYPASVVAFAAHAADVWAYPCPGSIADYQDLGLWRATMLAARDLGGKGSFCIHPAQVDCANTVFSPSEQEIAWAASICDAWEKRTDGVGSISVKGNMVDLPVAMRAKNMLSRIARDGYAADNVD